MSGILNLGNLRISPRHNVSGISPKAASDDTKKSVDCVERVVARPNSSSSSSVLTLGLAKPAERAATTATKPSRIVFTGGTCGGKSSALEYLRHALTKSGFKVYCVPESGTILINSGFDLMPKPTLEQNVATQENVTGLQDTLESSAGREAEAYHGGNAVILCDRGILDNHAFTTDEAFEQLLSRRGWTEQDVCDRYDIVIHMTSIAVEDPALYETDSNPARRGFSSEYATFLDNRLRTIWSVHPNRKVVPCKVSFEEKLRNVEQVVRTFLTEKAATGERQNNAA